MLSSRSGRSVTLGDAGEFLAQGQPILEARVALNEQPLPAGEDAALEGLASPIAIAADESCQSLDDLTALVAYDGGRIWCRPELWGGGAHSSALNRARQGETA